ncbi:phosphoribosylglycinamide formyltransferase, chloroplastic-like [Phragmites australis]|uniref:phosphoribosylglycinamide formyltransferase, chloroplastic-like n=1 Tax=Phragmites australis TaxID=29695 RepID=UPI002D766689|nr:phosphoribosylglycinamide formyltransferase, chloroplastic-like [Phragmites australis]
MEMEAAVAPPASGLRRSLNINPARATRPAAKHRPSLAARHQANAVRCELPRRPEARLRHRASAAAQRDGGDAEAGRRKRLAVFVSGGGSNFRAIHEAALSGAVHGDVVALVTDKPGCGGAEHARSNGVPVVVFPKSKSAPEGISVAELINTLREYEVDFVLLAGYLKLIPTELVQKYPRSILNIHPSLLPAFGGKGYYGLKVHKAVIASGARYSGPTVHFVDEHYDTGRTLAQRVVPVLTNDTPELLAARILHEEHKVYVEAVAALCEDRIVWREDGVPLIKSQTNPDEYI